MRASAGVFLATISPRPAMRLFSCVASLCVSPSTSLRFWMGAPAGMLAKEATTLCCAPLFLLGKFSCMCVLESDTCRFRKRIKTCVYSTIAHEGCAHNDDSRRWTLFSFAHINTVNCAFLAPHHRKSCVIAGSFALVELDVWNARK